jgi:urea transport system ATP-binding protein
MLEVNDLEVGYGQSVVVSGTTFATKKSEILAIMGRNGMGKTTLMKALMGILPARSGSIKIDGVDVTKMESYRRVQNGLAYVPQGRMVFPSMSVTDNIRSGMEYTRYKNVPDEIYALFPILKEMGKRKAGNLSGGQQQQLAIARALVADPKVLILDEPTDGIQPSIIKDIARILKQIKESRNICIIVCEQVLSFTLEICERIFVIESGRFVYEDTRANLDAAKLSAMLAV